MAEIAAVQTGKSMITEGIAAYMIDNFPVNMMFIYEKKDKIEEVFDERLKPMIQQVPAIRKYWNGDDNNLSRKRMKLIHMIMRVASAGLKGDIATHNAGMVIGDEFAKWPKKDFSQIKAIEGRTQASRMVGKKTKILLCTSPDNDQDPSYIECHKPNTYIFNPHYECPYCGHWQYLVDRQVKEVCNSEGVLDHNPQRIRDEKAAYYECEKCKGHITDDEHRLEMSFGVRWMTHKEKIPFDKVIKNPKRWKRAAFQWNRLVDVTWTFSDCLASFFENQSSPNANDLKTYINEDMADWVKMKAQKYSKKYIQSKAIKYFQYGEEAFIPDGVRVIYAGIDTQDSGFYYVIRGFGHSMESWLLRHDFITCDMNLDEFKNPAAVYERFREDFFRFPLVKRDGTTMHIEWAFIDRGGHRSGDVDSICNYMHNIFPYIGHTSKHSELIEYKPKSGFYYGNTEKLSVQVASEIKTKLWHVPMDVTDDYCSQVLEHYYEEFIDTRGHKKKKWITGDETGKADHYRDCECLIKAALLYCLQDKGVTQQQFFDPEATQAMEKVSEGDQKEVEEKMRVPEDESMLGGYRKEMEDAGW